MPGALPPHAARREMNTQLPVPYGETRARNNYFSDMNMLTIQRLHRQISGLQTEIDFRVEQRDNPWKEETARLAAILTALQTEAAQLERELTDALSKPPPLEQKVAQLEADLKKAEAEKKAMASEFNQYRAVSVEKIEGLEGALGKSNHLITELGDQLGNLRALNQVLEQQGVDGQAERAQLRQAVMEAHQQLEAAKLQHQRETNSLKQRLSNTMDELQATQEQYESQLRTLKLQHSAALNSAALALKKAQLEHAAERSALKAQIEDMQHQHQRELASLHESIRVKEEVIGALRLQLLEQQQRYEAQVEQLEAQLAAAIAAKVPLEAKIAELQRQLDDLLLRQTPWQNFERYGASTR